MIQQFWINLPVKDVKKSKDFFTKVGFKLSDRFQNNDNLAALEIGINNTVVMLFPEDAFKGFSQNDIADTKNGTEFLISIDTESKNEVDEIINKAEAAGAHIYAKPGEKDGWMYGAGFVDLDGHRWNILYMDMSKMPQQ